MIASQVTWALAFAAAGTAGLTLARPRFAAVLFLSSLPLFAHKVRSEWGLSLLVLCTVFEVAYIVRCLRLRRNAGAQVSENVVLSVTTLYLAASVLSLASLPLVEIVRQHAAVLAVMPHSAWSSYLASLMMVADRTREYSPLSALHTLEAFILCLIVWREARNSPSFLPTAALGMTVGLALFVALGLLEFQGVVSLQEWRGELGAYFDPSFTRLHSLAGNPGWFAEQLVYSMPFAVVLLLPGRARALRTAVFAALLAVVGLALVLSFQRGGWLAATAVLLFLAVVLVPARLFSSTGPGASLPFGGLKVVLLISLSLALAGAAFILSLRGPQAAVHAAEPYIQRLKSMTDPSARLPFFRAGYMLGSLHPILGGGSESYAYRYVQHFEMEGGAFRRQPIQAEFYPSAHNVYLQTFAGKGLVGVALLLGVFLSCFVAALPVLLRPATAPDAPRVGLIAATGSLVGFAVYGVFQEIFYIPSLQLLFFAVVGMIAALTHERVQWGPGIRRALWAALAVAFAAHLIYEYVYPGPTRVLRGEPTGFFAEERDPAGVPFRWTTERAWVPVPPSSRTVSLEVRAVAPYAQQTDVRVCGQRVTRLEMTNQDWRPVQSQTPPRACQSLPYLEIRTVPAWVPGADPRLLGVMVRKIEFR